jgi:hypothetical protein
MVIVCIQGLEPWSTFIFCFSYRCSCVLICRFLCCDAGLLLPSNCNSRLKTSQFQREWYLGFGVHQFGNGYRVLYLVLSEYRYMRKPFFFLEKTTIIGILHVLVLFWVNKQYIKILKQYQPTMNIEISLNSIICTSHSYFAYFHFDSTPIDKHAEHFH